MHISDLSEIPNGERNKPLFCTQDKEILSILEKLEQVQSGSLRNSDRMSACFCSYTVFNLTKKVLSDMEIKILQNGFDYAPIQNKIDKPELRKGFEDFARRMSLSGTLEMNQPLSLVSARLSHLRFLETF